MTKSCTILVNPLDWVFSRCCTCRLYGASLHNQLDAVFHTALAVSADLLACIFKQQEPGGKPVLEWIKLGDKLLHNRMYFCMRTKTIKRYLVAGD